MVKLVYLLYLFFALFLISIQVKAQEQPKGEEPPKVQEQAKIQEQAYVNRSFSAGIRLSGPTGFTFKKHYNKNAIELVIGQNRAWDYDGRRQFEKKYSDKSYHYEGNNAIYSPLFFQATYMRHIPFRLIPQLTFYYGFGTYVSHYAYDIKYSHESNGSSSNSYYREKGWSVGTNTLGGFEFKFKSIPIVLFSDASIYTEFAPLAFDFNLHSSFGVRYYWR